MALQRPKCCKYQHSWVLDGASSPAHYLGFSGAIKLKSARVIGRDETIPCERPQWRQQRHSCVACGKCDHRLETCTSRAAKELRKLKRQLAHACSRQTGCAKKKQRGRENRKDKHYKSEAKWKYSGKTGEQKRDRKRKRQDVLRTRELLRDLAL